MTDPHTYYESQFAAQNGDAPSFLRRVRTRGMERFAALGFPTTRLEDWKYTSVDPIARVAFRPAAAAVPPEAVASVERMGGGSARQLVFVNGHYVAALSTFGTPQHGCFLGSLAETLATEPARIQPYLESERDEEPQHFTAFNAAFMNDGAVVQIDAGVTVAEPIHLLFISAPGTEPIFACPRNLIIAGHSSTVTVVESYVGLEGTPYFTNAMTEVVASPNAAVSHCRLQLENDGAFHVGRVVARQERDSRFASLAIAVGAALARTDVDARLDAEGGECRLDGLYVASGTQHLDQHTAIDHRQPHCNSRELYKGVLDGRATAVFNGKVWVRPQAQKSDAQQMNKNLLLSEAAVINTKPQLEIFADDVKCSHGATIGRLDESALFYLRARGIDTPAARALLVYAFANELIRRVPLEPLQAALDRLVRARLGYAVENGGDA